MTKQCPTCESEMSAEGEPGFGVEEHWCPICGTLIDRRGGVFTPGDPVRHHDGPITRTWLESTNARFNAPLQEWHLGSPMLGVFVHLQPIVCVELRSMSKLLRTLDHVKTKSQLRALCTALAVTLTER